MSLLTATISVLRNDQATMEIPAFMFTVSLVLTPVSFSVHISCIFSILPLAMDLRRR